MKKIITVITLLALTACGAPDHGVIYKKNYSAPWSYTTTECVLYDGKTGQCKVKMPVYHSVPASWELCIELGDDRGCREVDQVDYHRYEVGQEYP